jgi:hypothetical protein
MVCRSEIESLKETREGSQTGASPTTANPRQESDSSCPQLYRMYRKLPEKPKQQRRRKQLRNREKGWSGREDLNLRPPGPEPGA